MTNKPIEGLHISHGVTKLGADIPSVSLPPQLTCREDAPCAAGCYARKGRFRFPHNKSLLENNFQIWWQFPNVYEQSVIVAAFASRFFRWHSAGEIPNAAYLEMMVRVARELPETKFLCFTKKYELINDWLDNNGGRFPDNFSIVLSAWGDWLPENPYNLPVAYIRFRKGETHIPSGAFRCPKYCGDCVMSDSSCWDLKRGEAVYFDEH